MDKKEEFDLLDLESMKEAHWRRFLIKEIFDIQDHVVETNGRLTKLEVFRTFALGVIATLVVVIVPVAYEVLTK